MEKNFLSHKNILITSQHIRKKFHENDEEKDNIEAMTISNTNNYFPKIRHKTLKKNEEKLRIIPFIFAKNERINLRNMKTFIAPINKTIIETNRLKNIKKNLVLKRFKELHKFKLEINPKNYYHNYGLNNYIIITNKEKNRSRNIDYKYNNISSYNNIFKAKKENKITLTTRKSKKGKEILLKNLPYRLNRARNDNGILKFSNSGTLTDENSIWRGKNINEMIHTSIDFDYLNVFKKDYKSMGKVKFFK
jgi:hypothetical protein